MYQMRDRWTDERLDDFTKHVDQRFDLVDSASIASMPTFGNFASR